MEDRDLATTPGPVTIASANGYNHCPFRGLVFLLEIGSCGERPHFTLSMRLRPAPRNPHLVCEKRPGERKSITEA